MSTEDLRVGAHKTRQYGLVLHSYLQYVICCTLLKVIVKLSTVSRYCLDSTLLSLIGARLDVITGKSLSVTELTSHYRRKMLM
jgi:hypothetical protein